MLQNFGDCQGRDDCAHFIHDFQANRAGRHLVIDGLLGQLLCTSKRFEFCVVNVVANRSLGVRREPASLEDVEKVTRHGMAL